MWLIPTKNREKLVYQIWAVFGQTQDLVSFNCKRYFLTFLKNFWYKKEDYEKRINYLIKEFEIKDFLNTPVRKAFFRSKNEMWNSCKSYS